jgi:hypothetical protein
MPRGKVLSEEEIGMIKAFKNMGLSNWAVACKLKRSPRVVNIFFSNPATYNTKMRYGRKSKLNLRQKWVILRKASNRSISAIQILHEFSLICSKSTVNTVINSSGVLNYAKNNQPHRCLSVTNRIALNGQKNI